MAGVPEGNFLEIEKRKAAFKYVFGILQTNANDDPSGEIFETGQALYADDLISGFIKVSNLSGTPSNGNEVNVQPGKILTWVTGSADTGNELDDLFAGSFSESIYDTSGANPNVEKIIMPLLKLSETQNQFYLAFNPSSYDDTFDLGENGVAHYDRGIEKAKAFNDADRRVRKWISPVRFGSDYKVQFFESNPSDVNNPSSTEFTNLPQDFNNNSFGGYIWDYNQGALYVALDTTNQSNSDDVNISSKQHPLWIMGYRYNGPTGSVALATTASFALNAGNAESADSADSAAAGTAGATPVLTDIISPNTTDYDWYTNNVMLPTDNADVYEYKSDENFLKISASIGDPNLLIRMGSTSFADITYTAGTGYDNDAQINDGNIFLFDNSGPASYPALSSYGTFITPDYSSAEAYSNAGSDPNSIFVQWTTHSFAFTSPKLLSQIELYYSNDDNLGPETYDEENPYDEDASKHIESYELYGSLQASSGYVQIASASFLNVRWPAGQVPGQSYTPGGDYFPVLDGQVIDSKYISKATSSLITDATKYQYYRLYVKGGGQVSNTYGRSLLQTLHHVDIIENKNLITNRKQIDFARNTDLTTQPAFQGGFLTEFDKIVSMSAAKLGLVSMSAADLTVFKGGEVDQTLFGVSPINEPLPNLQSFGQFTGSSILASGDITSSGIYALGNSSLSNLSTDTITINESLIMDQNSSLSIGSLQSLFFTNKKQDGTTGTDEYSARIFGHYTDFGVSDIYVDAYRIYNIADAKILLRTLHQEHGTIELDAPHIQLGSSLSHSLNISGSVFVNNHSIISASSNTIFIAPDSNVQFDSSVKFKMPITASGNISSSGTVLTNDIISNGITINGTSVLSGSLLISGSIIPVTDINAEGENTLTSSFSLGSANAAWKDLHLSDGTIRLYDGLQEKAQIGLNANNELEFKSGSEYRAIKAKSVEFIPAGSTVSSVQISDNGQGFVAVNTNGANSSIFRAEATFASGERMGSITQKGTGSFAILLDADGFNPAHPRHGIADAKFVVESNSTLPGLGTRLFSVSESLETRIHEGGLRADNYVTTTNITASIISASSTITANSFIGTFAGALSSSAQIATDISGAFDSFSARITTVETTIDGGLF